MTQPFEFRFGAISDSWVPEMVTWLHFIKN